MAETFNNIYVYSHTPETAIVEDKQILPVKWTDPVTLVQHSNLYLYSEAELNAMGWWKVMEEHGTNAPTKYEIEIVSSWEWRAVSSSFLATYSVVYKDLETVRSLKIADLIAQRDANTTATLDHKTDEEHRGITYRSLALLIHAFAQGTATDIANYVNTNTFLQEVKNKVGDLASEITAYNDRITLAETETDIPTLIAI